MNKIKYLVLILGLLVFIPNVSAASVTSATYDKGNMTIKGEGSGQTQIVIFNSKKEPLYMTTASVSEGKFNITLPEITSLVDGDYTIKVADYNGSNVSEKKIKLSNGTIVNPNTYDGIKSYIVLAILSTLGMISTIVYVERRKLTNKKAR